MEESWWKQVRLIIRRLARRQSTDEDFGDADIVEVFFWSVIHDRPQGWATIKEHWPIHLRRRRKLPSQATLSRRLRTARVLTLLKQIEGEAFQAGLDWPPPLVHYLDGKPLVIGSASKDRDARFGWALKGMAKGYRIHVLIGADGSLVNWRLTPMSTSEKVMGREMVSETPRPGYVVADGNYDDRVLHELCTALGNIQLVAPRSKPGAGLGHRKQSASRLRSIELLEVSQSGFGQQLLQDRKGIERWFGRLVSFGGGLASLPPWVRTLPRVHRWVSAKLTVACLRSSAQQTTYVAA
jgi:hypothetical protein